MALAERTIFMTRDSFCIADDVTAPNIKKYTWRDGDWCPECSIFVMIEDYLGANLPGFFWRGYVSGKRIVDVNLHREDLCFSRSIELVENWRELLREGRCIHFLNACYEDRGKLPDSINAGFLTFGEAKKMFCEQPMLQNKYR